MDRVMECRTSRPKTLGLAALAALMTGLAALVVRLPLAAKTTPMNAGSANAVGVAGVLFFGTALALTLSRLTSKEPFVTIGDEGIRIRGAVGLVPWEAMVSVWVAVANGTGFVSIELESRTPSCRSSSPLHAGLLASPTPWRLAASRSASGVFRRDSARHGSSCERCRPPENA